MPAPDNQIPLTDTAAEGSSADVLGEIAGFAPRDLYQKRERIFTRRVAGRFQRLRYWTGWPLLFGYFALPWLTWNGRPVVHFDLAARQFHVLGVTFWPQDFWLLAWGLIIAAFALFTVTNVVGRVWCGYTCPQTVWTAVFMWIEQKTEGLRHQRIRLASSPWTLEKLRKTGSKHVLWLGVAGLTGLTFVGYFTPVRPLVLDLVSLHASPWAAFWTVFFTAATYVNAGWMREQVCIYMCPYARFQSAMIDADTMIVSYDARRGEPRGSRKRGKSETALGDCIDCTLCVQVCPTGIDIRNGLQYQCIGCAQCIDACNEVMGKMGYGRDLIRYTTQHALAGGPIRHWRPRTFGYAAVLAVMVTAAATGFFLRVPFEVDVLRERGALFHVDPDGRVRNTYTVKIVNKSQRSRDYTLDLTDGFAGSWTRQHVLANEVLAVPLAVTADVSGLTNTSIEFQLCDADSGECVAESTRFLGPAS